MENTPHSIPISPLKRWGSIAAAVGSLAILGGVIAKYTFLAPPSPGDISRQRVMIDAETNEVVRKYTLKEGATIPFANPKTGRNTLYPAESCFWTSDGKAKMEPTYVLLNEAVGKPGPTTCPDCGRKVVPHNPMPPPDILREAYEASLTKK